MFKKLVLSILLSVCLLGLTACSDSNSNRNRDTSTNKNPSSTNLMTVSKKQSNDSNASKKEAVAKKDEPLKPITVGTISGPETQLMEVAKKVAKDRYGLDVKIVTFSDYNTPNAALAAGNIDANAFQHLPFLKAQIKARGYKIVPVAKTFIYPMGLYSDKITDLKAIKNGDTIAIPNDPSNEARALYLLQKANLISLEKKAGYDATPLNINKNRKFLKFVQLDAAELPRVLNDVTAAAINTNYAVPAGLSPVNKAIYVESKNSPYANLIVVRSKDKNNREILMFVKAFQSEPVIAAAKKIFGNTAIPAWDIKDKK